MDKDLTNKFIEPTKDNVEIGDFVVGSIVGGISGSQCILAPVARTEENGIYTLSKDYCVIIEYSDALILKSDGTYLVGKDVDIL